MFSLNARESCLASGGPALPREDPSLWETPNIRHETGNCCNLSVHCSKKSPECLEVQTKLMNVLLGKTKDRSKHFSGLKFKSLCSNGSFILLHTEEGCLCRYTRIVTCYLTCSCITISPRNSHLNKGFQTSCQKSALDLSFCILSNLPHTFDKDHSLRTSKRRLGFIA